MGEGLWFSATLKEGSKAKSVWSRTLIDWRSFKAISWGSNSLENKSQKRLPYSKINEDEHSRISLGLEFTLIYATRPTQSLKDGKQIEEIDRSGLTSVFEQEGDWSRFVILSIPVGTTGWEKQTIRLRLTSIVLVSRYGLMGSLSGAVGQALTVPCRTLGETDLVVS